MGPIQIRGTDLADRRWAAVMARWERAHGTDWSERSATGLYSRGDAAKGLGGNFGADTGRRDRAGAADGGYRWRTAAGPEYGAAVQWQRDGTGGLFPDLGAGPAGRRGPGGDRCDPDGVSHLSGGAGGMSGGRPGRREAGSHRGGVRLDRTAQRPRHRGKMSVIIWRRKGPMSGNTKRNIVVATMAVLVCAAVGLNWKYSTQEALQQAEETGTKILGEATLVSGQEGTELAEDTVYEGDDYFASARLTRQQARDSAISLLEDAAKQEDADKEVANQASESIQVLASYTLKEAQIENLVTAKGYTDCVAFMGDDSLSIVVSTADGTLNSTDVAKITDIAMTETGYAASAIRIMASN